MNMRDHEELAKKPEFKDNKFLKVHLEVRELANQIKKVNELLRKKI